MDDSDYDQLIVVTFSGGDRRGETLSQGALFRAPANP